MGKCKNIVYGTISPIKLHRFYVQGWWLWRV